MESEERDRPEKKPSPNKKARNEIQQIDDDWDIEEDQKQQPNHLQSKDGYLPTHKTKI